MKLLKRGQPASAISADQYNRMVRGYESMRGEDGVTVERSSTGEIVVKGGGGQYQFRAMNVAEFVENDNGTISLIMREVMVLCGMPGGMITELTFGAETDQEGNLTAINIGTHRVPVEDCGEDNGGVAM